jgi:hypothetical protein
MNVVRISVKLNDDLIRYGMLAQISLVTVKSPQELCAYFGIKPEDNYKSLILKNRVCPHSNRADAIFHQFLVQPMGYCIACWQSLPINSLYLPPSADTDPSVPVPVFEPVDRKRPRSPVSDN